MPSLARLVAVLVCAAALPAQAFVDFESGPVQPLRLSPDGGRLFVADTQGGQLAVFDLADPASPRLVAEIPCGLDPVSVHPRTRDEVWVTNQLSDSIAIVSVAARSVVAVLRVVDEPSDVVFAGGKAFVTAATRDEVQVFDAITRAPLGTVAIFGKDPRALATSPDGAHVYAVVQRSGNGTTILPANQAPPPPPPTNPALPPAPQQGLIVRADDPAWASHFSYTLPDHDIADIDVATLAVTRYFRSVGTTNTGIAVHPITGDLWVANTDARNLVRFEPALRGHAIDSRVTKITTGASPTVTAFDLNVGLNYAQLPNAAALGTALAEPFGVAIDAAAGRVYVAAQGTDRIGVLDLAGVVQARIEVGNTPGAAVDTRHKRGPRGLALHPTAAVLYVLNHLSDTLAVVDTNLQTVLGEQPIATVDPMPQAVREARNFLYDTKLSGNGTMSCASCHIDADTDGIAWDLGDPTGVMQAAPAQPFPFNVGLVQFHPMKGPMTTQTLRGIGSTGVLHWRGDRANFQAFNGAFASLLGGSQLATTDMNDYAAFANAIVPVPNPNQQLDRSLRTGPVGNNEAAGLTAFQSNVVGSGLGVVSCSTCHALPKGTNGFVVGAQIIAGPQQMKVPQLRNLYRKTGFTSGPGAQKSGFGFEHDGAIDNLTTFLALPVFNPWPAATKDDIATFLLSFDTGTAPAVGYQFVVDQQNALSPSVTADFNLLAARAAAGDLDLVAHGVLDGRVAGLLYSPVTATFTVDRTGEGPYTSAQLQAKALAGTARLLLTGVMHGCGARIALDRDLDGTWNGDEAAIGYGNPTPGCAGSSTLLANSEARLGNAQFGYAMANAPANSLGLFAMALGATSLPVLGIELLVDPLSAVAVTVPSDAFGEATTAFAIPVVPAYVGLDLFTQGLWLDACGIELWSSSAGLRATIRP